LKNQQNLAKAKAKDLQKEAARKAAHAKQLKAENALKIKKALEAKRKAD